MLGNQMDRKDLHRPNMHCESLSTGEYISLEHLDKLLLQDIRTEFYKYNTQFEQILKFKPIRKIQLQSIEINYEAAK